MSTIQQPIPMVAPTKYTITCRLCRQTFEGRPFNPPIDGKPDDRMNKTGKVLWDHVMKEHQEFGSMAVIISGFQIEDPVLIHFAKLWRFMIFQATRRAWVSDEKIHDTLSRLETDEDVEAAFKDLRDLLTETGKYGPQLQPTVQP